MHTRLNLAKGKLRCMWFLDFPDFDPDSNYPEPTPRQILYGEQARRELAHLKATLERLTIPQQREITRAIEGELIGGVFRREPVRIDPAGPKVEANRFRRLSRRAAPG